MTTATEDKILIAAAELFAEKGYAATTTRAIAQRAGVNEVTLFRRFENKAGILRALGERWAATQAGFVAPKMPDPEDTRGTIDALARMEVTNAIRDGGVAMRLILDAQSVPEVAEIMGSGPGDNMQGVADYFAGRQAAGDLRTDISPALMAETFFAVTSTLVMSRQLLGHAGTAEELGTDERMEQIVDLFWSGVRNGRTEE
jgi:AcrR family transcriptional regulator